MIQSARAVIGVMSVLACACATSQVVAQENPAPSATAAQNAVPAVADTTMATGGATGGERWTLDRCIATALKQNGDARAAHARTVQARGSALRAWSGVLPSLTTTSTCPLT